MKTRIKDAGFALFFLIIVALVAVEAADGERDASTVQIERTQVPAR